jgi:hypothetical protein
VFAGLVAGVLAALFVAARIVADAVPNLRGIAVLVVTVDSMETVVEWHMAVGSLVECHRFQQVFEAGLMRDGHATIDHECYLERTRMPKLPTMASNAESVV